MAEPTENASDLSALEDSGVAFDPTSQYLDLDKDEKRRTTALLMAIQAYKELIIREADYLVAAADLARREEIPALKPATIDAMVSAAIKFDIFIAGPPEGQKQQDDERPGDHGPTSDSGSHHQDHAGSASAGEE